MLPLLVGTGVNNKTPGDTLYKAPFYYQLYLKSQKTLVWSTLLYFWVESWLVVPYFWYVWWEHDNRDKKNAGNESWKQCFFRGWYSWTGELDATSTITVLQSYKRWRKFSFLISYLVTCLSSGKKFLDLINLSDPGDSLVLKLSEVFIRKSINQNALEAVGNLAVCTKTHFLALSLTFLSNLLLTPSYQQIKIISLMSITGGSSADVVLVHGVSCVTTFTGGCRIPCVCFVSVFRFADVCCIHLTSLCVYFKFIVQRLLLSADPLLCSQEVRYSCREILVSKTCYSAGRDVHHAMQIQCKHYSYYSHQVSHSCFWKSQYDQHVRVYRKASFPLALWEGTRPWKRAFSSALELTKCDGFIILYY